MGAGRRALTTGAGDRAERAGGESSAADRGTLALRPGPAARRPVDDSIGALAGQPAKRSGDPAVLDGLTPREREVLACLGSGESNAGIAVRLERAEATTKTHVSRILTKREMCSRVQAALLAQELGLVQTS